MKRASCGCNSERDLINNVYELDGVSATQRTERARKQKDLGGAAAEEADAAKAGRGVPAHRRRRAAARRRRCCRRPHRRAARLLHPARVGHSGIPAAAGREPGEHVTPRGAAQRARHLVRVLRAAGLVLRQPDPAGAAALRRQVTGRRRGMAARLKLRLLESRLQGLEGFPRPDLRLEQYETPPHIAALALHTIQCQYEEVEGRTVLDAGCGPGALGAGAALLGAGVVVCADVDAAALAALRRNVRSLDLTAVDAVLCDLCGPPLPRWENLFDTVVMNPPFGTKHNAGIDVKFLQMALHASCNSVYSFHKTSTRAHIKKKAREWGVEGAVVAELRYDLPATYRFHKQRSRDIEVDLWRLHHPHAS